VGADRTASPRSGMIWDGFQWHPAPNVAEAETFRAHKYPPHLIQKAKEEAAVKKAASVQQAAALQAHGAKLNTKYPPNPMNACPLVTPDIAAACAAAAAAAGKLTPQQATILQLASAAAAGQNVEGGAGGKGTEENGKATEMAVPVESVNDGSNLTAMLANTAVQQQMSKFFPGLMNKME